MEKPVLLFKGKKITPVPPKMLAWRKVAAFEDMDKAELSMNELMQQYMERSLRLLGHEELTLDDLASVLDVADVIPLYRTCADWLLSEAFAKLQKVPNGPAAEAQR